MLLALFWISAFVGAILATIGMIVSTEDQQEASLES